MPGVRTQSVLLVYHSYSSFVKADHLLLERHFKVRPYHFRISRKLLPFIWALIRQFLFLLAHAVRTDIFYCWFSDYHALLPVLFARCMGKRSVIIVGGYDAVSIPEIEYGIFFSRNIRAACARLSYKLSRHILTVDPSLIRGENTYLDGTPLPVGLCHFVSGVETKCRTVPTGYDPKRWHKPAGVSKQPFVLSVTGGATINQMRLKGIDLLLQTAALMHDVRFKIIGAVGEARAFCEARAGDNVEIHGQVPHDELAKFYMQAKVFCLFSLNEGLPNTLCEAMLCECIPVGSAIAGIESGIGDAGFFIRKRDPREAESALRQALSGSDDLGRKARQRIVDHFQVKHRERALLALLKSQ